MKNCVIDHPACAFGAAVRAYGGVVRAIALSIGLSSCAAALAGETLRLAVTKSALSLPLYIAQEKGFFASERLDVQLVDCVGGPRCMGLVLDGHADVATVGDLPIMLNSFERSDFVVIATIMTTGEDIKLITHARSGITRPAHLAGKRIGAIPGSGSQYFLETYLLTVGIDPRGLSVVALQPEDLLRALQAGEVDAIVPWEPQGYLAVKALGSNAVVLPHSGAYVLTLNLVSHRKLVGVRDDQLTRLLRAVERAERYIHEQPDAAKAILRTRLKLDQAFVDWVWGGMAFRLGLDQSLLTTLEGEARWARREGHVKGTKTPNFLTLLHTAPLLNVKPAVVGVTR